MTPFLLALPWLAFLFFVKGCFNFLHDDIHVSGFFALLKLASEFGFWI